MNSESHAAPLKRVHFTGLQIFDRAHRSCTAEGRAKLDIAEVKPELTRPFADSAIATATALSLVTASLRKPITFGSSTWDKPQI